MVLVLRWLLYLYFFIYFLGFLQGYSNGHKNGKIDTLKEYIVELNNKDK